MQTQEELEEQMRPKTPDFSSPYPSSLMCAHAQRLLDPCFCMCQFGPASNCSYEPLPLHGRPSPHVMTRPTEGMA